MFVRVSALVIDPYSGDNKSIVAMRQEPATKSAIAFIDGQNLFHSAKEAFGYTYPNFDPAKLTHAVCERHGWSCRGIRFYTGIPDATDSAHWNHFWTAKGAQMGRDGVTVFTRPLVYRNVRGPTA